MAFELNTPSNFKRKSSCSLQDEYESGRSAGMERAGSHDAKRRRTPMGNHIPFLQSPIGLNEVSLIAREQSCQQQQQEQEEEQHSLNNPFALHPPPQSFRLQNGLPRTNHGQQIQLNTPPLEPPNGFQISGQPNSEDRDVDDDMMMMEDDYQSTFTTTDATTTNHFSQHHSHTAPPSPVTPSLVAVDPYNDNSSAIKWEGTKHKGYPRDAYEDPNANLWTGGRVLRKNLDGQVKGFKMGYLEGCEKCRVRARGHFGHFIMADSI